MKTELVLNIQSPTFLSWKSSFKVDIAKMSPNPGSISLQMDRVDSISVGASAHMSDIAFKQLEVSVQQKLFSQPARKVHPRYRAMQHTAYLVDTSTLCLST